MGILIKTIILIVLAFFYGCTAKDPQEELRKRGYGFDVQGFVQATRSDDKTAVELFLKAGMNVNGKGVNRHGVPDGRTALHVASENNHPAIAEFLIAHGADIGAVDNIGAQPLLLAARNGAYRIVKQLLAEGANVNTQDKGPGSTPLIAASSRGHYAIVELLISKGADVNAKSKDNFTALHGASNFAHKETVELLIAHGADVNARTVSNITPLRWCVETHDRKEIAEILIAHHADVNIADVDGWSALNRAVAFGREETVKLLLASGAEINVTDKFGMTPLHWAVSMGNSRKGDKYYRIAEMLIKHGANVEAVDDKGRTPVSIAKSSSLRELFTGDAK